MNSIDVGIIACNTKGELTIYNKAIQDMHRFPLKMLPVEEWARQYDLFEMDGNTILTKEKVPLYQVLKNGFVSSEQITIGSKDENRLVIKCSGSKIKDENSHVYGAVVALHNITVQNKFEKLLSLSEKRFRGIFKQCC